MARIIPLDYPEFTYTGTHEKAWDDAWGWYIIFKTGGTLTFAENQIIDVFLCGGGSGGEGGYNSNGGYGGGGGYTTTKIKVAADGGKDYSIVIGEGGKGGSEGSHAGKAGGTSSAFDLTAAGGNGQNGTGVGGNRTSNTDSGRWGQAGGDGVLPFGDYGSILYGAGGGSAPAPGGSAGPGGQTGGGYGSGGSGKANTGGGGGGGDYGYEPGGPGGSGIVIIRNTEMTHLPVVFKGTTLLKMFFNGAEVRHLIHNGKQLFCEGVNAWRLKQQKRFALAAL